MSPTSRMASTTSSGGTAERMPASARSALDMAIIAPAALRLTHGTSTSPATGSHTRPSRILIAIAAAWQTASALPPAR